MRIMIWFYVWIILIPGIYASYLDDSGLIVNLSYSGKINVETSGDASVDSIQADIFFRPLADALVIQKLITIPESVNHPDRVSIEWIRPNQKLLTYTIHTQVKTRIQGNNIMNKVPFPITTPIPADVKEYLRATPLVDFDDPIVFHTAQGFTKREDDAFSLVNKMAWFVYSNVDYSLTTANVQASRKASWVLKNKNGVCDELTHLFIALVRAAGIPARFVTGIAYTNDLSFKEPWGPHGWAEVYFPGTGWVPFDPTYGQFGWIDATHVPLRYSLDGAEPSVRLEWLGRNAKVSLSPLEFTAKVEKEMQGVDNQISIRVNPLFQMVGFGSDNAIETVIKNYDSHYRAIMLTTAKTRGLIMRDNYSRLVILKPGEEQKMTWRFSVEKNLDPRARYEFPIMIYSDRNVSDMKSFFADGASERQVVRAAILEKTVNVSFNCEPTKPSFEKDENKAIVCQIIPPPKDGKLCGLGGCSVASESSTLEFLNNEPGEHLSEITLFGSSPAKTFVRFTINDMPNVTTQILGNPDQLESMAIARITVNLSRSSYAIPENVSASLAGAWNLNRITIDRLVNYEEIPFQITGNDVPLSGVLALNISWSDNKARSFSNVIPLRINRQLHWYEWPGYAWIWVNEVVTGAVSAINNW